MTPRVSPEFESGVQKKVCILGSYGVGKTSLVRRFVESIFDERYHTTVGVKIDRKRVDVDSTVVNMVLWDIAGEDELSEIRLSYLRGTAGYIVVADGTRERTIEHAIAIPGYVRDVVEKVPFVFAINKIDLADEWKLSPAQAATIENNGWNRFRTSALTGEGVEDLFTALARCMLTETDDERNSE